MTRPIQSMTGSGTATGWCELGRVTVEARSVNGRGANVRFRLAPDCSGLEPWIEQRVRERVVRGTVTVAADIVDPRRAVEGAVDEEAFRAGVELLRGLARASNLPGEPALAEVLARRFKTVFMPEYGREYWHRNQVERRLTAAQLVELAEEHLKREEHRLQHARRYGSASRARSFEKGYINA